MKELITEARRENITQVLEFIDTELEAADCPPKAQMQIDVAVDEVFTNIASYAYAPGTGSVTVRLDSDGAEQMVSVTFMDSGIPFDPLQNADPDVTLAAEERDIGGLGIFLVKKMMDIVEYRRENGYNVLTIRKKI